MSRTVLLVVVLSATAVNAQIQMRPTEPPLVTASSENWFVQREPIDLGGELYYPAGAAVFFNGNTMTRVGHYNGVPLYADATLEPFSIVLVPMSRGVMQPYERLRSGGLAGTTGSRAPSFPVRMVPDVVADIAMAAVAPTAPPAVSGAIGVFTPAAPTVEFSTTPAAAVGTTGGATSRAALSPLVSAMRPVGNDGVWISWNGRKWVSNGIAVPIEEGRFTQVGDYAGFAVLARAADTDTIYLPSRPGLVAPYRRSGASVR
jgi:hypothetical protein